MKLSGALAMAPPIIARLSRAARKRSGPLPTWPTVQLITVTPEPVTSSIIIFEGGSSGLDLGSGSPTPPWASMTIERS